jgi:hypothetical protein
MGRRRESITPRRAARSRAAWVSLSVGLAAVGLLVSVLSAAPSQAAGSGVLIPWALENENPNPSQVPRSLSQALQDAASFDFITAHPIDYEGEVAQMKAVNPSLILLAYQNATAAQPGEGSIYPASYYEYDPLGRKIINPKTGNYLMNPASPGWVSTKILQCRNFLIESGYDGCYLDLLGTAPLAKGFVSGTPINPATNQPWTKSEWLQATAGLAAAERAAVHPSLVFGNGLSTGPLFFDSQAPTKQLVDAMDGGVAESWLRGSKTGVNTFPNEMAWKQNVDMIIAVEAEGKPLLTLTKLWVAASAAQLQQWEQYALASFLMGTQGRSAFFFSTGFKVSRTTPCALCQTNVGAPLGAYSKVGGVYQRAFSGGRALVNPTGAVVTVNLGASYYTLSRQVVTSITMKPNTGAVLTTS